MLTRLQRERGMTLIAVTHSMEVATRASMRDGKVMSG